MEKRLLLSLLCVLSNGLIVPNEFLPQAKHYFQAQNSSHPEFLTSIQLLEHQKEELRAKIRDTETQLERFRSRVDQQYQYAGYHPVYGCHHRHSSTSEFVLLSVIPLACITALNASTFNSITTLEREQKTLKENLSEVEASLEKAYFEQLHPEFKKKLLLSKIDAYTSESGKLTNQMSELQKTAQKKFFYTGLSLASTAGFITTCVSLACLKSQPRPYMAVAFLGSLFATVGFLSKATQAEQAHKSVEDIQKKLALFKEKKAAHAQEVALLPA
jgi:hypothetical protein